MGYRQRGGAFGRGRFYKSVLIDPSQLLHGRIDANRLGHVSWRWCFYSMRTPVLDVSGAV